MGKWIKKASRFVLACCLVWLAIGGLMSAKQVASVAVSPLEGTAEVSDGLGGKPDLRVELREGYLWRKLDEFNDTPMGDGLVWTVDRSIRRSELTSIRLVEDDPADDDVIETVDVDGGSFDGEQYYYEVESSFDVVGGLKSYATGSPGLLVAIVAFIALILSLFSPLFIVETIAEAVVD